MSISQNISEGPAGYTVRFVRDGNEFSKYFRFSDGGKRAALRSAKAFRDQQLKKLGPRAWKKGPRKKSSNNTSGYTGISKNVYGRWVATWQQDGKQRFKSFRLRRDAIAHRKKQLVANK